ncbi:GeoRSP system SPASM domain protein [Geobacter hydrogenophilus]|uniref:GeoRSP system SPASM domain protein n=1 Tax=Geobacter hydrogenophilus TaxID=40983 RepID=A0A9W6G1D3_9BACT|nr:GeoRSP system SPASM domain protein [Geobacter hydrogenophilus]MBT0894120.1 GeoRSP system SPASM domain protein [Geobacter hydrogenophilus]GLI38597.1 GeoRSP system SPASM domain protein [Geobacter hydrogenophilus]
MELASPITIYWDLPSDADEPSGLLAIAADIIACRPLMVWITGTAPTLPDGFTGVLEQFREGSVSVILTIPRGAFESARGFGEQGLVRELLLAVDRVDQLDAEEWAETASVGISFAVTSRNWRELPDLVRQCPGYGITRLVLPMQRLYGDEPPFFLTVREQQELADALDSAAGASKLTLTIHDPFIWRAFNPGVPFPQGGCQAANTMIAIAPDGGVYPCPTLPVRLGTVGEASLREIIASAAKKELRQKLLEHPGACRECKELAECRGGCRGRAYVVHQSLEGEDPACW